MRRCQMNAKSASRIAPTATGTSKKLQDMLFTTTSSGSRPNLASALQEAREYSRQYRCHLGNPGQKQTSHAWFEIKEAVLILINEILPVTINRVQGECRFSLEKGVSRDGTVTKASGA